MTVTDSRRPDNPIIFCNDAFSFMTGYTEQEIIGTNCRFPQGPETDRDMVAQVRAAIEKRKEVAVEILNYRKNGSTFWNALFVSPVFDEAGTLTGGIAHDFKILLQVILGYVGILEARVGEADRSAKRAVEAIQGAARR